MVEVVSFLGAIVEGCYIEWNGNIFNHLQSNYRTMHIFNVSIPDRPLKNIEFPAYALELDIPCFKGVFMRDTLPHYPIRYCKFEYVWSIWQSLVCYYRNGSDRIYFDSYGQITPVEIQRYLEAVSEFDRGKEVIQRNTYIEQAVNTSVCGHLCLFLWKSLTNGEKFQSIWNRMRY